MWRKQSIHRRRSSGFTLVEVIITTAIIGILSSVTIGSMSEVRVRRDLEGNARVIAAALREAQNDAITGKNIRGNTCSGSACVPCGFRFSASGNSFTLSQSNASMDGTGGACSSFAGGISVPLSNGVTVSNTEVWFGVPRAEPKSSPGADLNSGSIDFELSKSSMSAHVCVYPLGRVEERPAGSTGC
jgi:prepilin-type N-terminal cleavage/methylation domain-containing protein